MAKKSLIEREKKRKFLFLKYKNKRNFLKKKLKNCKNLEELFTITNLLEKLPKNSSITRIHNRCWKTGRSRSYYSFFGLSRSTIIVFSSLCLIPGLIKSTW